MAILKIYTDGACSGNQSEKNAGGWGAVLEYGQAKKELCGGEANTTNNRMEMKALIEALSALKKDDQMIEVFSDSSYLMECFRKKWYEAWRKNGWKTSKKTPVENQELWQELLPRKGTLKSRQPEYKYGQPLPKIYRMERQPLHDG